MDPTKVSFGPTSIIGYLSGLAAAIPLIIKAIEDSSTAASVAGGNKYLAIYSVVAVAVTTIVRGFQAGMKAHAK